MTPAEEMGRTPEEIFEMLKEETGRYRDELLEETGITLTVEDAQRAVEAFDQYVSGRQVTVDLTEPQRKLFYRFIRRIRPGRYR